MIIEIHYFCFGLYISKWKVFLLPTSHLWLLVFPTCNDFPIKVLICIVTMYFSNVQLGTGGGAAACPIPRTPPPLVSNSVAQLCHARTAHLLWPMFREGAGSWVGEQSWGAAMMQVAERLWVYPQVGWDFGWEEDARRQCLWWCTWKIVCQNFLRR